MKKIIETANAPKPVGPYNQAVIAGSMLFASGQIAIDPATNELLENDIEKQTERVLKNIKEVLKAAGADLDNVVKTTVFLKDLNDFAAMNQIYQSYFAANSPARSTIEVSRLPKDVLVEIDCIAEVSR